MKTKSSACVSAQETVSIIGKKKKKKKKKTPTAHDIIARARIGKEGTKRREAEKKKRRELTFMMSVVLAHGLARAHLPEARHVVRGSWFGDPGSIDHTHDTRTSAKF